MRKYAFLTAMAAASTIGVATPARPAPAQKAPVPEVSFPGDSYYYFCLGRMYEMEMQTESAISNYQEAARLDPKAAYPHVALAALYQRTRQMDKALESAKKAVELGPDVAAGHRILGSLYFSLLRSGGSPDLAPLAIQAFRDTVRLEPGDVQSRSELARLLLANREKEEAAEQLAEVVRVEPNAYYEMYLLAQIRQGEGKTAEAIQLLEESIAVEPRQPEAREMLVGLLQSEQRFDELAEVYQNILDKDPKDVDARVRHADALANGGHLSEAAKEFETALNGDPENVIAMVGLAMVHRELKEFDQAEELLQKVLTKEPNHVLARFTLASVYEDRRELDKAVEQWKKLIALPGEGDEVKVRRAEYWAHLGFAYGELDRQDDAVDAFAHAKELAGDDERFEIFLVQAFLNADRPADARKALDEALPQHPKNLRLKMLDAQVLQATGETDKAIAKALELSESEPKSEMLIQGVVDIYQKQKAYAKAEAFLTSKLELLPDSAALRFQLGAALERQKKFDEAEVQFKKVLELEPDSAAALNYLGYMLADRGVRLEESVRYIQRALKQDPHNGAYLDSLGWAYFRMGKLDLAEDNLLQAVRSLRLTGVVYDHLGDLYFRKGNRDRAISYWKKALDQDDDELEKDQVARKIEDARSTR